MSSFEGTIKIRCTTLDFNDKQLKPVSLNPHTLIIKRNSGVIYQTNENSESMEDNFNEVFGEDLSRLRRPSEVHQIVFDRQEDAEFYSMQTQDELNF